MTLPSESRSNIWCNCICINIECRTIFFTNILHCNAICLSCLSFFKLPFSSDNSSYLFILFANNILNCSDGVYIWVIFISIFKGMAWDNIELTSLKCKSAIWRPVIWWLKVKTLRMLKSKMLFVNDAVQAEQFDDVLMNIYWSNATCSGSCNHMFKR